MVCYHQNMIRRILGLTQINFDFGVDLTHTISQVVLLSGLRHKPYPVKLGMIIIFYFRRRLELYDRLHHCPIGPSS